MLVYSTNAQPSYLLRREKETEERRVTFRSEHPHVGSDLNGPSAGPISVGSFRLEQNYSDRVDMHLHCSCPLRKCIAGAPYPTINALNIPERELTQSSANRAGHFSSLKTDPWSKHYHVFIIEGTCQCAKA